MLGKEPVLVEPQERRVSRQRIFAVRDGPGVACLGVRRRGRVRSRRRRVRVESPARVEEPRVVVGQPPARRDVVGHRREELLVRGERLREANFHDRVAREAPALGRVGSGPPERVREPRREAPVRAQRRVERRGHEQQRGARDQETLGAGAARLARAHSASRRVGDERVESRRVHAEKHALEIHSRRSVSGVDAPVLRAALSARRPVLQAPSCDSVPKAGKSADAQ
mmetsp:Transcript_12634/g.38915  ORF Transcript_12634/g.38915 Transcript_12634/m.38915 type:complete len:226 (-) Transcript_12634:40-717(-)